MAALGTVDFDDDAADDHFQQQRVGRLSRPRRLLGGGGKKRRRVDDFETGLAGFARCLGRSLLLEPPAQGRISKASGTGKLGGALAAGTIFFEMSLALGGTQGPTSQDVDFGRGNRSCCRFHAQNSTAQHYNRLDVVGETLTEVRNTSETANET